MRQITLMVIVVAMALSCGQQKSEDETKQITVADSSDRPGNPAVDSMKSDSDTAVKVGQLAAAIGKYLKEDLVQADTNLLSDSDRKFSYSEIDLNGDNEKEIFVSMKGRYFCGNAGCTVFLLDSRGKKINGFTIVNGPIVVTSTQTNGWRDLIIPSGSGRYFVRFSGKRYPGNPSVQQPFKGDFLPEAVHVILSDTQEIYSF